MRERRRLFSFILIIQLILFLAHFFLYETWAVASGSGAGHWPFWLAVVTGCLSISFVSASLLAFRYTNALVRTFYRLAATWLGLFSFLFLGAVAALIILGVSSVTCVRLNFHRTAELCLSAAALASIAGLFNASWTRITRATVQLANLPKEWRGRKAALISDVHLGHVRNRGFLRRMIAKISQEKPDVIFIAGDLYDGTAIDADRSAEPLSNLTAPHGVYFVAGNHEQFGDDSKYLNAIESAGVRVLRNEKVELEGLQLVGVPYRNATQSAHLASALQHLNLDRDRASILLI